MFRTYHQLMISFKANPPIYGLCWKDYSWQDFQNEFRANAADGIKSQIWKTYLKK